MHSFQLPPALAAACGQSARRRHAGFAHVASFWKSLSSPAFKVCGGCSDACGGSKDAQLDVQVATCQSVHHVLTLAKGTPVVLKPLNDLAGISVSQGGERTMISTMRHADFAQIAFASGL